jgi:low temperature requirement protein LtrA
MWLFRRVLVIYWPDREYHPFLFACIFDCIDIMDDAWGFILIHMWQFACGWYLMRVYFHTSEGYPHGPILEHPELSDWWIFRHLIINVLYYLRISAGWPASNTYSRRHETCWSQAETLLGWVSPRISLQACMSSITVTLVCSCPVIWKFLQAQEERKEAEAQIKKDCWRCPAVSTL